MHPLYTLIAFVVAWAPTVLLVLGFLGVAVRLACLAKVDAFKGLLVVRALQSFGTSIVFGYLPFVFVTSIAYDWPTKSLPWPDAVVIVLAAAIGVLTIVVSAISDIVAWTADPEKG